MRTFGRLRSLPDPRNYPLATLLAAEPPSLRVFRYWFQHGWWGDQGDTPQCVAYGGMHWLEDGPVTHNTLPAPMIPPTILYGEAQTLDGIPGEDYDGTTVHGLARALKLRGHIGSYHWAANLDEVTQALLEHGPVVFGTNWYADMMDPDINDGFVTPTGAMVGEHCYVVNGVNTKSGFYRIKNSWGRGWGERGNAWIRREDLAQLLREDGEAMLAVERHE